MGIAQGDIIGRMAHLEKSVLGCLVEFCLRGSAKELDGVIAAGLAADQFADSEHRAVFRAMLELRNEGKIPDVPSLTGKLDDLSMAHVLDVTVGVVPENLGSHLRDLHRTWHDNRFAKQLEELTSLTNAEDRLALLDRMRETLLSGTDPEDCLRIFHTWAELENAPPLRFAINNFLQEGGVTLIGGLSGQGKTLMMLAMTKALLDQAPLFEHDLFAVEAPASRVIYLVPESAIGPFKERLELFRLLDHFRAGRLLVSTLSSRESVSLNDSRMLKAVEGADVFLDTAVRFMEGSENDAQDTRPFVETLFRLLRAGARSITGAHHAPKGFEGQNFMTLENIPRGSGDIGAMLSTAWGIRQVDADRTALYVQNVKARDFQPCRPFVLEGRPNLDRTGHFLMIHKPGEAGELSEHLIRRNKGGRPVGPDKNDKLSQVVEMRREGASLREIGKTIGVSKSRVDRWLKSADRDASQTVPIVGQFRDTAEPDGETPS